MIIDRNILNKIAHHCATCLKGLPARNTVSMIQFIIDDDGMHVKYVGATMEYDYFLSDIRIGDNGVYAVNAWKFVGVINALVDDNIDLTIQDNILNISTERTSVQLNIEIMSKIPTVYVTAGKKPICTIKCIKDEMRHLLDAMVKCLSFADDKGRLSSVNMQILDNQTIYLQSCNSRGACTTQTAVDKVSGPLDITIDRSNVATILELFKSASDVAIDVYSTCIVIASGMMSTTIMLVDIQFPPVKRIIPLGDKVSLPYDKKQFNEILMLAGTLSESYKLRLQYSKNRCNMTLDACVQGTFDYDPLTLANDVAFGVDYRLLKNVFKYVPDNGIIQYSGEAAPLLFNNDNDTFIVMPMLT